jgi:hypothetical protein
MNKTKLAIFAALSLASISAEATVLVSGEYLEITDRVSEPIVIDGGSRVIVRDGEIITSGQGLPNTGAVTLAVPTGALRNTFEMQGNSFLSSANSTPIFFNFLSTVRLSDNSLVVAPSGGNAIQARGVNGLNYVFLEDRATVVGSVAVDAHVYISDQARITGRLTEANGSTTLTMSGGSINGGVSLWSAGEYAIDISGGRIDNGFVIGVQSGVTHFNMSGGEIHGGLTMYASLNNANIFDGSIYGGLRLGNYAPMSMWGGSLHADQDEWLIDTFNISPLTGARQLLSLYGGQIGQLDAGRGIRLGGINGLDVYGYDLNLTNGVLSGYLSDGNWLNVTVTTGQDWTGAINLHDVRKSVPEPSTALLFLTAAAGMFGFRRRKAGIVSPQP